MPVKFRGAAARSTSLPALFPIRFAGFLLFAPFALFPIAACEAGVSTPVGESAPMENVESQGIRADLADPDESEVPTEAIPLIPDAAPSAAASTELAISDPALATPPAAEATPSPLAGLLTHDYIDLDAIARISRFRSAVGHDYSGGGETCRNMKHYFEPRADVDWSGVSLYAPAAGQIDSVETEWAGDKLNIALDAAPEILVTIFHVRREPGLEAGSPVLAGQKLGQHIGPQSMSDIAVHDRSRDYSPLSYFELLDGRLLDAYRARGVRSPAAAIISRAQRDADPLRCAGEHGKFLDPPRAGEWLVLEDGG